jgi:hypothetical protein
MATCWRCVGAEWDRVDQPPDETTAELTISLIDHPVKSAINHSSVAWRLMLSKHCLTVQHGMESNIFMKVATGPLA